MIWLGIGLGVALSVGAFGLLLLIGASRFDDLEAELHRKHRAEQMKWPLQ